MASLKSKKSFEDSNKVPRFTSEKESQKKKD